MSLALFLGRPGNKQVVNIHLQRFADRAEGLERNIVLGRLDPAEVGTLHATAVGDGLDGQAFCLADLAHASADLADEVVIICH